MYHSSLNFDECIAYVDENGIKLVPKLLFSGFFENSLRFYVLIIELGEAFNQ